MTVKKEAFRTVRVPLSKSSNKKFEMLKATLELNELNKLESGEEFMELAIEAVAFTASQYMYETNKPLPSKEELLNYLLSKGNNFSLILKG